jgi:hypothetical protein
MSEEFDTPSTEYKSLSWSEVWISALTKPSVETYERLVHDPGASANKAYGWVFICTLIGYALSSLIGLAIGGLFDTNAIPGFNSGALFGSWFIQFICCLPIVAILAVVGLVINTGLTQLIARALGGTGTYSELVYANAAYLAPISLVSSIIFAIPYVNLCLSIPLAIYSMALTVIAINAVNQLGWGKAIVAAIIVPLVIIVFVACGAIAVISGLALTGPQIGDVFSEIIRELSTPVP